MEFVSGTVVAGRFRLVRELGHGGMGSVWLAQDTSLDTPCAIKFIHGAAAEDPQMRARFEREAKSAAQLRSPNVVQILDHGLSDGTPYMAMELLEGEDLEQRLRRVGRLSPQETVYIISQVGKALTRATQVGLVHRDLKPANIFLVRDEDRDIPKVLDFGVAKSTMPELADSSTKTGALMGTPYYMSPEQTRGLKTLDHRSDLWALGVIVFQCVTGRLPFLSESLGDLLFKIGTDPLPVPTQVAPDLPASFDAWWARAAMRDPAQRYQTAKEFVDALALAFGMAPTAGFPAGGPMPSGAFHGAGAQSGGWGGSQSGRRSAPPAAPSTETGVTARSITDKPEGKRGPGLIIGIAGGVGVVVGLVIYLVASRTPTPAVTTAQDHATAAPHPTEAPAPATAPTPVPVVAPSSTASAAAATASAATPPPSATAEPSAVPGHTGKPAGKPLTVAKPAATAPRPPPKPTVPNDGI